MSTRSIGIRNHGKHAKNEPRMQQLTHQKRRLAGASLALMLSVSSAALTQGATLAFASESDDDPVAEAVDAPNASAEISAEMIPLASTSLNACVNALSADLGHGSSLMDAASYDPVAERNAQVETLIDEAISHLGTPYRYGGTTPAGFDCSGFTGYAYRNALGIELPRSAAAQSGVGEQVSLAEAQRGDLVFWGGRGGVYHTGIYLGDGEYIHAAASGCVQIQNVATYAPSFAMRLI